MSVTVCGPRPSVDANRNTLAVKLITGSEFPADLLEGAQQLDAAGPFGRAIWWSPWWQHMRGRHSELFLVTVWHGERLVGLAPWYTARSSGSGRVVRFLGDGRACSDYATIAAVPEYRVEVWREITQWVAAEAGRSWDAIILSGVSGADLSFQTFFEQLRQQDVLVDQRATANTWRVALPDTWDAYLALLSKQHRNRVRRMKRDMFDSGRATFHRVTTLAELDRGFKIQQRLHQVRRASLGDAGCFADPRFAAFVRQASQNFLEQGALSLQWTEVEGQPVAFDSGYVDQKTVFVYQTGFDPTQSELSPGRLHFQHSILNAIEQGFTHFDFLRGDEPYKAHFRAMPIPVFETRLIGPRKLRRLRHRVWSLQKGLRARVRTAKAKTKLLRQVPQVGEKP